jgi:zinc transporter ZupT
VLAIIILCSIINGALSLSGGLAMLVWSEARIRRLNSWVIPITAGVLLATALFDILPETLPYFYTKAFVWIFVAISAFFFLGQFVQRLTAGAGSQANHSAVIAIAITSVIHNLIYGALIAIFADSLAAGLAVAIVLGISDIPHEIGVSGLLLHHGLTRHQAGRLQIWLTAPTLLGGLIGYGLKQRIFQAMPLLLSLLAGWFIYVVVHDTFMQMEQSRDTAPMIKQLIGFSAGALLVVWILYRFGNIPFGYHPLYIDHPL